MRCLRSLRPVLNRRGFADCRGLHHTARMARDYGAAIGALNTLQSNFAVVDAIRKSGRMMNQNAISEMVDWCRRIGYEPSDFDPLNAIHIAGTKGKGSTSTFVSSILTQYGTALQGSDGNTAKIGLYTSPHLRFVRERIQINNKPLSESVFATYFWEVWDRLEASAKANGHSDPSSPQTKPVYFRFLTLMALHCYLREGVTAAVIECGIGGEYDSTNILVKPAVTAITNLGIDHTAMLGDTVESIAWHKAGIFKTGVPAFTVEQSEAAMEVLVERAKERQTKVVAVPINSALQCVKLGLAADFQKTNASLAVAVAGEFLRQRGVADIPDTLSSELPRPFIDGLEQAELGGRCETRHDSNHNLTWYIDGGHTQESIEQAGQWFGSLIAESPTTNEDNATSPADRAPALRILIFNQQTRDANALARKLYDTLSSAIRSTITSSTADFEGTAPNGVPSPKRQPFTHAIFTTNTTYVDAGFKADLTSINTNATDIETLSVQNALADTWSAIDPEAQVKVVRTIEEAVVMARDVAGPRNKGDGLVEEVKVLVTGSLHLVGGLIEVLEAEKEASGRGQ